jgi:predicted TIM-barrel fold metal-dependent hydrolase
MNRFLVISSDGHAGLPPEQYRAYLDPKYRADFDEALPREIKAREIAERKFLVDEFNRRWRLGITHDLTGAWDPAVRDSVLDRDGITAEVLFPDGVTERNAPPFGADIGLKPYSVTPELQWAGAQAHNRWLAEFCATSPHRRIGLAIVPALYDMERNLAEVRWAKKNGLKGIYMPCLMDPYDPYNHPKYNPLWELCQELRMPIHFHSGGVPPYQDLEGMIGIYLTEFAFWMTRPMWTMIFGGVFVRYPQLKVVITEGSEFWVPWMLQLMDVRASVKHTSGKLGDFRTNLKMKPSEYFRRNFWIGASALSDSESTRSYYDIGVDKVLWGTDYPHPEGTWPRTRAKMRESLGGLPVEDVDKMLGLNALDVYDVDRDAVVAIAAQIGLPKQELAAA